jgi:hypothetical protein
LVFIFSKTIRSRRELNQAQVMMASPRARSGRLAPALLTLLLACASLRGVSAGRVSFTGQVSSYLRGTANQFDGPQAEGGDGTYGQQQQQQQQQRKKTYWPWQRQPAAAVVQQPPQGPSEEDLAYGSQVQGMQAGVKGAAEPGSETPVRIDWHFYRVGTFHLTSLRTFHHFTLLCRLEIYVQLMTASTSMVHVTHLTPGRGNPSRACGHKTHPIDDSRFGPCNVM